jgi:hypothetical protein
MARRPTAARVQVAITGFDAPRAFDAGLGRKMAEAAQRAVTDLFRGASDWCEVARGSARDGVSVTGQIAELELKHGGQMLGLRLRLEASGRSGRPVRAEFAAGETFDEASPSPRQLEQVGLRMVEDFVRRIGRGFVDDCQRSFGGS